MNKELQDKAWSVLPKEFKEEVKKLYREFAFTREGYYVELFGLHNLTSDAEGEEMLTVPRRKVQEMWQRAYKQESQYSRTQDSSVAREELYYNRGIMSIIDTLFGSKCLPDLSEVKRTLSENLSEQKPAEPKFKIGDKVKHSAHPHDDGIYRVDDIKKSSDGFIYHIQGLIGISNVKESDLEPYAEPEEESRNLSQETANCDKQFDKILNDSLRERNRLNIAAMIEPALISCPDLWKRHGNYYAGPGKETRYSFAKLALEYADALIAECEKGGSDEN